MVRACVILETNRLNGGNKQAKRWKQTGIYRFRCWYHWQSSHVSFEVISHHMCPHHMCHMCPGSTCVLWSPYTLINTRFIYVSCCCYRQPVTYTAHMYWIRIIQKLINHFPLVHRPHGLSHIQSVQSLQYFSAAIANAGDNGFLNPELVVIIN